MLFLFMSVDGQKREKISVVMPALDEASIIGDTLSALEITEGEELIVVDGGSTDATVSIAGKFAEKVLSGQRGRARQMNLGAENADGQILFFLHSDCVPPQGAFSMIRETLELPGVSGGAFDIKVDDSSIGFRIIEKGANLRSRITGVPYGDQGLFMRKSVFLNIGGFRDMPLMEDIEISGRLKKEGRIVFLRPPIRTSPRRWLREGLFQTTIRDWSRALSYAILGADPEKLAERYRDVR